MQRDLYIDFAKGIATLSIIFIHTAFWSGQFYILPEIRVYSLVFDVALFYALSGITSGSNIEKTLYRLLKLQITYMIFVTLLFFLDYFFKVFGLAFFSLESLQNFYATFGTKYAATDISVYPQWQNLGNWYLHQYSNADTFPVVMGSFWYLKVYFILTVFGVLILKFFPRHVNWFIALCVLLTLIFNIFPQYYPGGQVGYVAFYMTIFLVANRIKGKKVHRRFIVALYAIFFLFFGIKFINYLSSVNFSSIFSLNYNFSTLVKAFLNVFLDFINSLLLNKSKFPPRAPYIIWTFFSLATLFFFYNRLKISKESFVTFIGKNAIFFYFAQGISSSLVYFIVVPMKEMMPWWLLMIIIYIINVVLAFSIAVLLKRFDAFGWKVLEFLRQKTAV